MWVKNWEIQNCSRTCMFPLLMCILCFHCDLQNFRCYFSMQSTCIFMLRRSTDFVYDFNMRSTVERRDKEMLIPIIQRECAAGSVIHSDEWASYWCLTFLGFEHDTLNHQQNFIDPHSGAHTQAIERSWLDAKVKLMKKMRGVPKQHFQSHLDHVCWRALRNNEPDSLFISFLRDVRTVYR